MGPGVRRDDGNRCIDNSDKLLSVHRMGHADHERIPDGGMRDDELVHLQWRDVDAAALDHVFLTAGDEKISLLVEITEIAGVKPAVAERFIRRLRVFVITMGRQRALADDLADLAHFHWIIHVIDNPKIDTPNGPSG